MQAVDGQTEPGAVCQHCGADAPAARVMCPSCRRRMRPARAVTGAEDEGVVDPTDTSAEALTEQRPFGQAEVPTVLHKRRIARGGGSGGGPARGRRSRRVKLTVAAGVLMLGGAGAAVAVLAGSGGNSKNVASPRTGYLATLGSSQYSAAYSAKFDDSELVALGQGVCRDISAGANGQQFYVSGLELMATDHLLSVKSVGFLTGAAVRSFCPRYVPVFDAWNKGQLTANAHSLGIH